VKDLNDNLRAGRKPPIVRRAPTPLSMLPSEQPSPWGAATARLAYGGDIRTYLGTSEPLADPCAVCSCDGLVVRAEPGLILGEPKIGKTLVIEDLALCLVLALALLGPVPCAALDLAVDPVEVLEHAGVEEVRLRWAERFLDELHAPGRVALVFESFFE